MFHLNQLIMVIIAALLLWLGQYIPMPPLISLVFNFFILVILIIYIMQFLGLIKFILPAPQIFK